MKIGVLAITVGAKKLASRLVEKLEHSVLLESHSGIHAALTSNWKRYDGLICIMATGIVVRGIAPLLQDKRHDPCVVVSDEKGENVISLLSGHLGGGNELAKRVAVLTGGRPIITTASDVLGLTPLDIWAQSQNLVAASHSAMTRASAYLVNNGCLHIFSEIAINSLPKSIKAVERRAEAEVVISNRAVYQDSVLTLHPQNLVVGVGCNRGTPVEEFERAMDELLAPGQFSRHSVRNLASIDLKQDEIGLLEFAAKNNWEIDFYSKEKLNTVQGLGHSPVVYKATGAKGVAEPAVLLSAANKTLLKEKQKWPNITMALAVADCTLSEQAQEA